MTEKTNTDYPARRFGSGLLVKVLLVSMALSLMTPPFAGSPAASPAVAQETDTKAASSEGPMEEPSYEAGKLEMVRAINDYREENGLSSLKVADTVSVAAQHHSEDMATYDFFSHTTTESDYYKREADFAERLDREGYDRETFRSENIAAGQQEVEPTLKQWKTSPRHDENMLREDLEVIGIGKACSEDSSYGCYWTTDFGSYTPEEARTVEEIHMARQSSASKGSSDGEAPGRGGTDNPASDASTNTEDQYGEGGTEDMTGSGEDSNEENSSEDSPGQDQYAREVSDGRDSSSDTSGSVTDPSSFDQGEFMQQMPFSEDSGDEGANEGGEQCESAMDDFSASPFDEDFGEQLQASIQEEVSCEMEAAGVASAGAGEDSADKQRNLNEETASEGSPDENPSNTEDTDTTSIEQTSSEETIQNDSSLDQANKGSAEDDEEGAQDMMRSFSREETTPTTDSAFADSSSGEGSGDTGGFFSFLN